VAILLELVCTVRPEFISLAFDGGAPSKKMVNSHYFCSAGAEVSFLLELVFISV
jgi:hypothetical protein